jgi:hypothetical protein
VAPLARLLPSDDFRPEAFAGRAVARAGIGCRGLILLELRSELLHKLIAGLGSQGRSVLVNLRLRTS